MRKSVILGNNKKIIEKLDSIYAEYWFLKNAFKLAQLYSLQNYSLKIYIYYLIYSTLKNITRSAIFLDKIALVRQFLLSSHGLLTRREAHINAPPADARAPESAVREKKQWQWLCCVREYLLSAIISVTATKKRRENYPPKREKEKKRMSIMYLSAKKGKGHISALVRFFYIALYSIALAIFIIEEGKGGGRGATIYIYRGFSVRARDEKPKWHVLGALRAGR